ncbi:response regulator transcription factor [Pseudomonas chlororaphis]|uniref:response regulator n=1 Tax=Pseudomonas chlororaphis TaxID=587753 RepID=UPI000470B7FB
MKDASVRVIIADDHPLTRLGVAHVLEGVKDVKLVYTANDSTDLVPALSAHDCDILILDYFMPKGLYGDGFKLLTFLRQHRPSLPIVLFTMLCHGPRLRAVQDLGVRCILSKSDSLMHLPAAIHAAQRGDEYLSPIARSVIHAGPSEERVLLGLEEQPTELLGENISITPIASMLPRGK